MAVDHERVIIVADGDVDAARLVALVTKASDAADRARPFVIAADGGASQALHVGVRPDLVIGDGDSLDDDDRARLHEAGIETRTAETDKDESDTELCLLAALESGARRISVVGALGGARPEHSLANLLLLADPRLDGVLVELVSGATTIRRIGRLGGAGSAELTGRPGDFVSLFAVAGPAIGVRTAGLRFALDGETLAVGPARGLSNELVESSARVTIEDGCLLVVQTARR